MRIKKAVYHQFENDVANLAKQLKNKSNQKDNTDKKQGKKQFRELNHLFYQNYKVKDVEGKINAEMEGTKMSRMFKKTLVEHLPDHGQKQMSKSHHNSQNLTSQASVNNPSQLTKNNRQINNSPATKKPPMLQKLKSTQLSPIRQRGSSFQNDLGAKRHRYQGESGSLMDEHVNQLIRESMLGLRDVLVDRQGRNKSETNVKNKNHQQENRGFLTLSTIKQKIQKYLAEEESKMKQLNNSHLYSSNPKLNGDKGNKLRIQTQEQLNEQLQMKKQGIFSSLTSLTRKKEVKYAYDMMKRRLNFSLMNKPIKDKEDSKRVRYEVLNFKKRSVEGKEGRMGDSGEGLRLRLINEKILEILEKQPGLLDEQQRRMLVSLGFRLRDLCTDQHGKQKMRTRTESVPDCGAVQVETSPQCRQLSRSYVYNLNYFKPQQPQLQKPLSKRYQQPNQEQELRQQAYSRYREWKSKNHSEERLKQLVRSQLTNPLDPVECYYESFGSKCAGYFEAISKPNQNKKHPSPVISNSNSGSLKPLHKRKRLFQSDQSHNPETSQQQNDKIIFVSKKYKQNVQQKKLSNLLQKIQKRNSQLQKLSRLQLVEIFKSQKNNHHQPPKINGRNIAEYVEEESILKVKKQKLNDSAGNFIVQWPKKDGEEKKEKEVGKKVTTVKRKNKDDWTEFEPWVGQEGVNEEQHYDVYYAQAIDKK